MAAAFPDPKPCGVCMACDVRKNAICAALDEHALAELERIMTSAQLDANQVLIEQGDKRRRVFSLTSGMLRLSAVLVDGRRQITGFLMPGDYLGLADDDTYSQTAEAVVPSTLCAFQVPRMDDLMKRHPNLQERLFKMTRAALRAARDNQIVLGRLAPVEKLASFLLMTSDRASAIGQAPNPVHLPMTRMDIADYLGLTIETVSRSFTKMKVQGLIRLPEPHLVDIIDRRALESVAGLPS